MTGLVITAALLVAAVLLVHLVVYRTLGPKRPGPAREPDWRAARRQHEHRRVYVDEPGPK